MRVTRVKQFGLLYGTGVVYLLAANFFPTLQKGWITFPLAFAMVVPVMIFFRFGTFAFLPPAHEAADKKRRDGSKRRTQHHEAAPETSREPRQPVPTLLLLREAETASRKARAQNQGTPASAPSIVQPRSKPPQGNRPATSTSIARSSSQKVSRDIRPTSASRQDSEQEARVRRRLRDEDAPLDFDPVEMWEPAIAEPVPDWKPGSGKRKADTTRKRTSRDQHSLSLFAEDAPDEVFLPHAVVWRDGEEVYL